ncbi:MAG: hypothetical protein ACKOYJ_00040 [Planctomycetia bacterium]
MSIDGAMPRFAMLEHTGAPDDPAGRHFDLLLEDGEACRTWRLLALPAPGAVPVAGLELPRHRLAWLDILDGEVSGGRGHARRIDAGTFEPLSLDAGSPGTATSLVLRVTGGRIAGRLRLEAVGEGWAVSLS